MQIDLSMEEAEFLLETLQEKESRLRLEISHTSRREYRQALQHRLFVLEGLLDHINQSKASVLQECP